MELYDYLLKTYPRFTIEYQTGIASLKNLDAYLKGRGDTLTIDGEAMDIQQFRQYVAEKLVVKILESKDALLTGHRGSIRGQQVNWLEWSGESLICDEVEGFCGRNGIKFFNEDAE